MHFEVYKFSPSQLLIFDQNVVDKTTGETQMGKYIP